MNKTNEITAPRDIIYGIRRERNREMLCVQNNGDRMKM